MSHLLNLLTMSKRIDYRKPPYQSSTLCAYKNDKQLDLTHREFELLYYLAQHLGEVITRENLLETVWGYDYFGDVRTVDVTVRRLREKS